MLIKSRAACAAWLFLYPPANTKFIHLHLYRRYSKCYNKQWEDDYHMTFSNTLKQARESLGMTQMELSRALGVSFSTINRYENGYEGNTKSLCQRRHSICIGFRYGR